MAFRYRTGQYVAIAVDLPSGYRQPRQYTISSGPRGDSLGVTIKRVRGIDGHPDGEVSGWLHDNAEPGTLLDVSPPAGDVILDDSNTPLVLVSAGIDITPVAAIMEDLSRRQPDRHVTLFHADKSHAHHALYHGLRRQVLVMPHVSTQIWYEEDADQAPTLHPAKSGFMDLTEVELPAENINYEVFGPDMWAQNPA